MPRRIASSAMVRSRRAARPRPHWLEAVRMPCPPSQPWLNEAAPQASISPVSSMSHTLA